MKRSIGVIGLGKLGLPLAILLSRHFKVYGVDINPERLQQILNREQFFEPKLNECLEKYGDNFTLSLSYETLQDCDVVFIITQTPSLPTGRFDLQYLTSALKKLHEVNPHCLAVISSTINIGDMDKLKAIHNRIAYNPEFIKQGSIIHDFENPKFVLIGTYQQNDGEVIASIWRKFHDKPAYIINSVEAEIAKLSLNMNYTLSIIFANMVGEICEVTKVDSTKVLDVIYKDRRDYKSGLGFGGPCFPRDAKCLQTISSDLNIYLPHEFAVFLERLNNYMIQKYVYQIKSTGKRKIGILGIAYKQNVPYIYESQPLKITQELLKDKFEVYIYDKLAEQNAKQVLNGKNVQFCSTLEECIRKAEVLFIGTSNYSKIKCSKPTVNPWR